MRKVELVPFLLTEQTDIFTIRIEGDASTELEKFLVLYKDSENNYVQSDLESILKAISNISQNGALESYFRLEGSFHDRLVALPIYVIRRNTDTEGTLRLYGIRVSNRLLILGGGGLKTTRTYEEDYQLHRHVKVLQDIDKAFKMLEQDGIDLHDAAYNLTIEIE